VRGRVATSVAASACSRAATSSLRLTRWMSTPGVTAVIASGVACEEVDLLAEAVGSVSNADIVPPRSCTPGEAKRLASFRRPRPMMPRLWPTAGSPAPGDPIMASTYALYHRAFTGAHPGTRHFCGRSLEPGRSLEHTTTTNVCSRSGCLARSRAGPGTSGRTSTSLPQVRSTQLPKVNWGDRSAVRARSELYHTIPVVSGSRDHRLSLRSRLLSWHASLTKTVSRLKKDCTTRKPVTGFAVERAMCSDALVWLPGGEGGASSPVAFHT
jgi:hypothetical protein